MHHPGRVSSLESLKKEAKQWLRALRANAPDAHARWRAVARYGDDHTPTLRDVQHALAVERGYTGWLALQQTFLRNQAAATETLAHYEEKVDALLEAYHTGTPEAMERHWRLTWHRRAWAGMRTYVQVGLGYVARDDIQITRDDARWLIAREHGFEDWPALCDVVRDVAQPAQLLAKPMSLLATPARSAYAEPPRSTEPVSIAREWQHVLQDAADGDVVGVDAHGQMTDAMMESLCQLSHITTLRLGGSSALTDVGIARLARMPNLQHLDLSSTAITDAGVAALASLSQLRSLSLSWTRTTDAGIAALAALEHLEEVDLGGSHCGDGAIRSLAGKSALSHFASGQRTTDNGLAWFREYPVFSTWREQHTEIALLSPTAKPNRLHLRGNITGRGVAHLASLNGLFALDLDDSSLPLTGNDLTPLVNLPHLGWLAFDAKDDAMPIIARMPQLRYLGCQDTSASDRGWVALGASRSIEQIWGRRCYGLERDGFLSLSRMPRLSHLSVSCKNVDDVGIAALPDFPALRELMPMDIPDEGYQHIGRCHALSSLVLMYCRDTTDAATECLTGLDALEKYFASYTQITDRTPELLSTLASLTSVTFDSCAGLTNAGIAHLARLPALRELRVSGRGLTSAVAVPFRGTTVSVQYSL
jgi:Leucine-rich repeat (LRR) protein